MRIYNVNILGEVIVAERPENATPPLPKPFHPILTIWEGVTLGQRISINQIKKGTYHTGR